jgi:hypothetical protein
MAAEHVPVLLPDGVNVEWDPEWEPDFDHAAEIEKRRRDKVLARMSQAPTTREF